MCHDLVEVVHVFDAGSDIKVAEVVQVIVFICSVSYDEAQTRDSVSLSFAFTQDVKLMFTF